MKFDKLYYRNLRAQKREKGLCSLCGRKPVTDYVMCEDCRAKKAKRQQKLKQNPIYKKNQEAANKKWRQRVDYKQDYMHIFYRSAWSNLQDRCRNPNSNRHLWYGDKGVQCLLTHQQYLQVMLAENCSECQRQMTLDNHATGKTIDRIDNDGNYTVENCRCICRSCNVKKSWRENPEHGHGSFGRD